MAFGSSASIPPATPCDRERAGHPDAPCLLQRGDGARRSRAEHGQADAISACRRLRPHRRPRRRDARRAGTARAGGRLPHREPVLAGHGGAAPLRQRVPPAPALLLDQAPPAALRRSTASTCSTSSAPISTAARSRVFGCRQGTRPISERVVELLAPRERRASTTRRRGAVRGGRSSGAVATSSTQVYTRACPWREGRRHRRAGEGGDGLQLLPARPRPVAYVTEVNPLRIGMFLPGVHSPSSTKRPSSRTPTGGRRNPVRLELLRRDRPQAARAGLQRRAASALNHATVSASPSSRITRGWNPSSRDSRRIRDPGTFATPGRTRRCTRCSARRPFSRTGSPRARAIVTGRPSLALYTSPSRIPFGRRGRARHRIRDVAKSRTCVPSPSSVSAPGSFCSFDIRSQIT